MVYVLVGWNSYSSDRKSRGRTFFSDKRTVCLIIERRKYISNELFNATHPEFERLFFSEFEIQKIVTT